MELDYIIFGIGSGASLVLIGWAFREWGPVLRDRDAGEEDVLSATQLVWRMSWARFCATCGMALILTGTLVLIATAIAVALSLVDATGTVVVTAMYALAMVLMLVWLGLYLRQFGTTGVIRPKQRSQPAAVVATPAVETTSAGEPEGSLEEAHPEQATPDFAETVQAPGGLGRFSSFFKKHEPSADTADATVEESLDDELVDTATDDVIAAITAHEGDEKRLDPDDPLVTSVRAEIAANEASLDADPGAALASPGDAPAEESLRLEEADAAPDDGTVASDSTDSEMLSGPEAAFDTLRRRRIARLAQRSAGKGDDV